MFLTTSRAGRAVTMIALLFALLASAAPALGQDRSVAFAAGDTLSVGPSTPQRWVNVVGTVVGAEPDTTAEFRIGEGGWRHLTLGPDERRLAEQGDFNADILVDHLVIGSNTVEVRAQWSDGHEQTASLSVERFASVASDGLVVDWAAVDDVTDVGLPVDGSWTVTDAGVTNDVLGYDRLLALGDVSWDSYEVTVPVTLQAVEPKPEWPSFGAAVGVIVRWRGHEAWDSSQPVWGWYPFGANLNHTWWKDDPTGTFHFEGNRLDALDVDHSGTAMAPGDTFILKIRAESVPGHGTIYRSKYWPADAAEPDDWSLSGVEPAWEPQVGGMLLLAHHTQATFGDVTVLALDDQPGVFGGWARYILLLPAIAILFLAWRGAVPSMPKVTRAAILLGAGAIAVGTVARWTLPDFLHDAEQSTNAIGAVTVALHGLSLGLPALVALMLAIRSGRAMAVSGS